MSLYYKEIESPLGILKLVASTNALIGIEWPSPRANRLTPPAQSIIPPNPILTEAERQLSEYFARTRTVFELPLELRGSDFQKKVWERLTRIPFGQTKSYGEIARAIGSPRACRAVGAANGKNPLPIVVPCHRVVGATGALVGFGGGLEMKAKLLAHEQPVTRHDETSTGVIEKGQ